MNLLNSVKIYYDLIKKGEKYTLMSCIFTDMLRIPFYFLSNNSYFKVTEENWDYLIILDACRYDILKEVNDIPGKLEKRKSQGSQTEEWLQRNFSGHYEDIVYISANPLISHVRRHGFKGTEHFFKVINVWDFGWNEELSTVPPAEVTKAAIKAKKEYPNKRMIIHYVQPHLPFIGETKISANQEEAIKIRLKNNKLYRKGYKDNVILVLNEVKKLVRKLDGKIVISADHGELIERNPIFQHPHHLYIKKLLEVPWFIVDKNNLE